MQVDPPQPHTLVIPECTVLSVSVPLDVVAVRFSNPEGGDRYASFHLVPQYRGTALCSVGLKYRHVQCAIDAGQQPPTLSTLGEDLVAVRQDINALNAVKPSGWITSLALGVYPSVEPGMVYIGPVDPFSPMSSDKTIPEIPKKVPKDFSGYSDPAQVSRDFYNGAWNAPHALGYAKTQLDMAPYSPTVNAWIGLRHFQIGSCGGTIATKYKSKKLYTNESLLAYKSKAPTQADAAIYGMLQNDNFYGIKRSIDYLASTVWTPRIAELVLDAIEMCGSLKNPSTLDVLGYVLAFAPRYITLLFHRPTRPNWFTNTLNSSEIIAFSQNLHMRNIFRNVIGRMAAEILADRIPKELFKESVAGVMAYEAALPPQLVGNHRIGEVVFATGPEVNRLISPLVPFTSDKLRSPEQPIRKATTKGQFCISNPALSYGSLPRHNNTISEDLDYAIHVSKEATDKIAAIFKMSTAKKLTWYSNALCGDSYSSNFTTCLPNPCPNYKPVVAIIRANGLLYIPRGAIHYPGVPLAGTTEKLVVREARAELGAWAKENAVDTSNVGIGISGLEAVLRHPNKEEVSRLNVVLHGASRMSLEELHEFVVRMPANTVISCTGEYIPNRFACPSYWFTGDMMAGDIIQRLIKYTPPNEFISIPPNKVGGTLEQTSLEKASFIAPRKMALTIRNIQVITPSIFSGLNLKRGEFVEARVSIVPESPHVKFQQTYMNFNDLRHAEFDFRYMDKPAVVYVSPSFANPLVPNSVARLDDRQFFYLIEWLFEYRVMARKNKRALYIIMNDAHVPEKAPTLSTLTWSDAVGQLFANAAEMTISQE